MSNWPCDRAAQEALPLQRPHQGCLLQLLPRDRKALRGRAWRRLGAFLCPASGSVQGSGIGRGPLKGRALLSVHALVPHQQIGPQHLQRARSWGLAKELSVQARSSSHTRPELSGGGRGSSPRRVLWLLEIPKLLH